MLPKNHFHVQRNSFLLGKILWVVHHYPGIEAIWEPLGEKEDALETFANEIFFFFCVGDT